MILRITVGRTWQLFLGSWVLVMSELVYESFQPPPVKSVQPGPWVIRAALRWARLRPMFRFFSRTLRFPVEAADQTEARVPLWSGVCVYTLDAVAPLSGVKGNHQRAAEPKPNPAGGRWTFFTCCNTTQTPEKASEALLLHKNTP